MRTSEPDEYLYRLYTLNEVIGGFIPFNHVEKACTRLMLTAMQAEVPECKKFDLRLLNRNRIEHTLIEANYTITAALKEELLHQIDTTILPSISTQLDIVVSKVTGDKYLGKS